MQKNKSPSVSRRILPRKWRKNKVPQPKGDADNWSPEGNCQWCSAGGQQVTLTPTNLTSLSEAERLALQKLAVARLQAFELGVNITIPKDAAKRKRSGLTGLRRRATSAANLTSLLDNFKTSVKETPKAKVFGVSLSKCINNDKDLKKHRSSLLRERRESLDLARNPRRLRKSSSSSGGAFSSDSLDLDSRDSRDGGGNLLEALSLSTSPHRVESSWKAHHRSLHTSGPQVPYVVRSCVQHIETYGLNTLGIFRKGSSKKKTKQLKEEFDSGHEVKLGDEQNPHEVAALLKEYFRDLPDPLLTRELYSCFLASRKLTDGNQRLRCLHYLLMLLPAANRDTLWTLLKFLLVVSQHSTDSYDYTGQELEGNKMDSHNLATLFGPNLLHKARGGLEREYQVENSQRAAHSGDVIAIVKEMIDHHTQLFTVSAELHDEVLQKIKETNPDWVNVLLRKKLTSIIEPDGDTQTSCYESDGSLPRSPGAASDPGGGLPKSFTDGMMLHMDQKRVRPSLQFHSVDPPSASSRGEKVMTPQPGAWYNPDSRSPSPRSPVLVRKQPPRDPKLHLNVPQSSSDRSRSSSVESRKGLPPSGLHHRKNSPLVTRKDYRLAVPAYSRESSTSSQGSYLSTPSSSPGTRGPPSPMLSSVPSSPASREPSPLRPSSKQRPLGIPRPRPVSAAPRTMHISPEAVAVQRQRWRQWEQMARENSEDYHEQETLV